MVGLLAGCIFALVGSSLVHFRRLGWWMWFALAAWAGLVVWLAYQDGLVDQYSNLIGLLAGNIVVSSALPVWLKRYFPMPPRGSQRLT